MKHKKSLSSQMKGFCAESEGFEPPVPFGTMVFKTTAFDHSANSPKRSCCFQQDRKNNKLFEFTNTNHTFLLIKPSHFRILAYKFTKVYETSIRFPIPTTYVCF